VLTTLVGAARAAHTVFPGKKGRIAFQRFVGSNSDIFTMGSNGKDLRPLVVSRQACEALPTWSPNGKTIAFERNPGNTNENLSDVFVVDATGHHLTRLTSTPGFDGDPSWSPDGNKIVFESGRDGNREIYVMDVVNGKPKGRATRLTDSPGFDGDPAWSPGGRRIAFTSSRDGNREIYLMNPDGSALLNITRSPTDDFDPSWSPSGQFVIFTSMRSGGGDIYLTNDRFQLLQLTNQGGLDALPAFSPDGKSVAFTRQTSSGARADRDIYVMSATGGDPHQLYHSRGWDVAPDYQRRGGPTHIRLSARSPMPALQTTIGSAVHALTPPQACVPR
jgi:Tol biopolymer transport system component